MIIYIYIYQQLLYAEGLTIWKITIIFKCKFANGMLNVNRNPTLDLAKGPGSDVNSMGSSQAKEEAFSVA